MSTISEILDRLSGVTLVRDRVAETSRHVDKALAWLLDHEKRLLQLELAPRAIPAAAPPPAARPRLTGERGQPDAQP